jgi:hypothetical protein
MPWPENQGVFILKVGDLITALPNLYHRLFRFLAPRIRKKAW